MRPERAAALILRDYAHHRTELGAETADLLEYAHVEYRRWPKAKQEAYAKQVDDLLESGTWHPYESAECFHEQHVMCGYSWDEYEGVDPTCPVCSTPCVCDCHDKEQTVA